MILAFLLFHEYIIAGYLSMEKETPSRPEKQTSKFFLNVNKKVASLREKD